MCFKHDEGMDESLLVIGTTPRVAHSPSAPLRAQFFIAGTVALHSCCTGPSFGRPACCEFVAVNKHPTRSTNSNRRAPLQPFFQQQT